MNEARMLARLKFQVKSARRTIIIFHTDQDKIKFKIKTENELNYKLDIHTHENVNCNILIGV